MMMTNCVKFTGSISGRLESNPSISRSTVSVHYNMSTNLERMNHKIVVGGEHVERVVACVEACLAGGPGEWQLRDVLQYPRLLVWRRLINYVIQRQRALVGVRVIHVAFRICEVATSLQKDTIDGILTCDFAIY